MANEKNNDSILLSALLTLLLGGGIVVVLFLTSLHYKYPPEDALLQQLQEPIEFGGEDEGYVQFEEMLAAADQPAEADETIDQEQPTEDNLAQEVGQDLNNQGSADVQQQSNITTNDNSTAISQNNSNQNSQSNNNNNNTTHQGNSNSTTNTNNNQNTGSGGNGKNKTGEGTVEVHVSDGLKGLKGNFAKGKCVGPGYVKLKVEINTSNGKITNPELVKTDITGDKRDKAISTCQEFAKKSNFAVEPGKVLPPTGTITYIIP